VFQLCLARERNFFLARVKAKTSGGKRWLCWFLLDRVCVRHWTRGTYGSYVTKECHVCEKLSSVGNLRTNRSST
jgi:hypothetical protein